MMRPLLLATCLMATCLLANLALACKVPVFRYALERWPADNYHLVAIVNGSPSDETKQAVSRVRSLKESKANVEMEVVDLSKLTDDELWQVEGLQSTDDAPLLQVFYPERNGQRKLCWEGSLTLANINAWIQSPLRQRIANDIHSGVSAVWVLVDGSDQLKNDALHSQLKTALEQASTEIAIPEGVIRREDASQFLKDNPGASMDDVLRSDIPLRIDFSIQQLKYDDQDEFAIRAMIAGIADSVDAPFVFPVFGRGRMIEPLTGSQFDSQSAITACRYMVGECSCSVKALNPGVDLILNTDWKANLGDQIVMVNAAVPASANVPIPPGTIERSTPPVVTAQQMGGSFSRVAITALIGCVVGFLVVLSVRAYRSQSSAA